MSGWAARRYARVLDDNVPATLSTEKHRIVRVFFDHRTGRTYDSIAAIPGRRSIDQRALGIFLRIGYVPGHGTLFEGVDCLPGGCELAVDASGWTVLRRFRFAELAGDVAQADVGRAELAALGARRFVEAVAARFRDADRVVVPLSGGMDSRAVLGALLEMTDASRLNTYTYGVPGTSDYEIGNSVAHKVGTRHVSINEQALEFNEARLLRIARLTDANTDLMQPVVWLRVLELFGNSQFWTGFTGDGLGGSHFLEAGGDTDEAVPSYVAGETGEIQYLSPSELRREDTWGVARETKYDGLLSRREAVWFENHVERYTAHHIFLHGVEYVNPFMDDHFAAFMLSIPPELRRGKSLFDEMLTRRFRMLFQLPTKDHGYGLTNRHARHAAWWLEHSARKALFRLVPGYVRHPRTSYLDFALAIRRRADVRHLAENAFASLAGRGLLDRRRLENLLQSHLSGRANHAPTITLLTSLEMAIRALCEEPASPGPSVSASEY